MGDNLPAFKFFRAPKDFTDWQLTLFLSLRDLPQTAQDHVPLIDDRDIDQTLSLSQSFQGLIHGYLDAPISLPVTIECNNNRPAAICAPQRYKSDLLVLAKR